MDEAHAVEDQLDAGFEEEGSSKLYYPPPVLDIKMMNFSPFLISYLVSEIFYMVSFGLALQHMSAHLTVVDPQKDHTIDNMYQHEVFAFYQSIVSGVLILCYFVSRIGRRKIGCFIMAIMIPSICHDFVVFFFTQTTAVASSKEFSIATGRIIDIPIYLYMLKLIRTILFFSLVHHGIRFEIYHANRIR